MHATFTSGIARRRDIDAARLQNPEHEFTMQDIEGINAEHEREGRVNPILDLLRDEWDAYGAHAIAVEYLFQLARHWAAWQSPRISTFPLDYRDPSGPASREDSEESGEDRVYWEIDDALTEADRVLQFHGHGDRPGAVGDRIQDYIVHATAVLDRIYEATKDDA